MIRSILKREGCIIFIFEAMHPIGIATRYTKV